MYDPMHATLVDTLPPMAPYDPMACQPTCDVTTHTYDPRLPQLTLHVLSTLETKI